MNTSQLQNKIMRRVYYAYSIRLAKHPLAIHGLVLLAIAYLLARVVHVAAVYNNFINVKIGDMGMYITNTLFAADAITLTLLGLSVFTLLSLRLQLKVPTWRKVHTI